jgi:predicted amidohydrolase YtcJ
VVSGDHVKIMQDGIVENFTTAMLAPYLDGYGHATEGTGLSYFRPAVLNRSVTRLDGEGFQVHFHAIGDRAVREALDAARRRGPRASRNQPRSRGSASCPMHRAGR